MKRTLVNSKNANGTEVSLLVIALVLLAQAFSLAGTVPGHIIAGSRSGYWTWTGLAWTGDDTPYAATQAAIDAGIARGLKFQYFQRKYHQAAIGNPSDPVAQFADAYSSWASLGDLHNRVDIARDRLSQADDELTNAPDPRAYHYERLRYVIEAALHGFDPHLRSLGERLLVRDPSDLKVKYRMITMLAPRPGEDALAIRYCSDLLKADPNHANNYTVVAGYYWRRFDRSHAKADGDEAIADYNRFLQLAPADDGFRLAVNYAISRIQKEMAKYDQ
jgi:tetratricopeptide (TPR) repeat protein